VPLSGVSCELFPFIPYFLMCGEKGLYVPQTLHPHLERAVYCLRVVWPELYIYAVYDRLVDEIAA